MASATPALTTQGKPKSIAILNENTDFGVSAAKSAKLTAEQKGIKVVFEEAYSAGSPDYRSTLSKVKAASPERNTPAGRRTFPCSGRECATSRGAACSARSRWPSNISTMAPSFWEIHARRGRRTAS